MILIVQLIWHVSTKNAKIHVQKVILVHLMLNVEYHITDHCAIVQLVWEVIHILNVTNVSIN